ncbi:MAG TPA: efflux RND transporter periplasmic adaptor subunit [Bryobacteraceae bacterium]|nr:efflux RND transporter periplasmic adaptor subunit [Bryobacteraceae bacterium]
MKRKLLTLLLLLAAWMGGYGYGRWYAKAPAKGAAGAERKILYYHDPMHPWYKSDKPGIAPDCGMKLVPVYEGGEQAAVSKPANLGPGAVEITPEKQQLIGVEYGTAEYRPAFESIRAAARVTLDETRIAKVQTKIEGWIDRVFVDFTGIQVRQGQPLLTIYSPEALATQQEYLLALKAQETMAASPVHELMATTDNLLAAARRRLELWDISAAQIDQIEKTRRPLKDLTLYAPIGGFVTERNAFPKQRITPDTVLYTVADLSTVWVMADVFEYEAANIRVGQDAVLTLSYLPGRSFHGRVSYIQPQVDPATRTLKVRLQFENPGYLLKPEMYGDVEFRTGGGRKLMVPQSAVLNAGLRQVVFVDRGNGYFEPRSVKLGAQVGDRVEILSGLAAGERIVVSGNFLIDSESQLKAALNDMAGEAHDQPHH